MIKNRFVRDRVLQHLKIDQTIAHHWQIRNPDATLFQLLARIENGLMLCHRGDDVVALFGIHLRYALCKVVGFSGAARENDLLRRSANKIRDLLPGLVDGLFHTSQPNS